MNGYDINGYNEDGVNRDGYNEDGEWVGSPRTPEELEAELEAEFEKKKRKAPYYVVAKNALMNWNGLTEEEAQNKIENLSFDDLEALVGAKSSMTYAVKAIVAEVEKVMSLRKYGGVDQTVEMYLEGIFGESTMSLYFPEHLRWVEDKTTLTLDVLSAIHDGWVKDNSKKFFAREKKHQHMPIELIGWNEAKSDLLFLEPILAAGKVKISEEELETAYNERVGNFLNDRGIKSTEDLQKAIAKGAEFYPALEGQDDILLALSDPEFVSSTLIPQIEEKGIGSIERIAKERELAELQSEDSKLDTTLEQARQLDEMQNVGPNFDDNEQR